MATAFLGGLALSGNDLHGAAWSAVGLFLAVVVLAVLILTPWRNWVFVHHPHGLLSVYLDPGPAKTLSEFRRSIAYYNGVHYEENGRRLRVLFVSFALASVCLVAELVIWLWLLAK